MARGSKSKKGKDEIEESKPEEDAGVAAQDASDEPDSEGDAPVIIEAEAVEVDDQEDEAVSDEETVEAASGEPEGASVTEATPDAGDAPLEGASTDAGSDGDTSEKAPSTADDAPPPVVPAYVAEPSSTGPSFIALLLGGILAGAIGYGASFLSPPPRPVTDPALSASIDEAGVRLDTLAADIATLRDAPPPEAPVADFSDVEARLDDLGSRLDAIGGDLAGLRETVSDAVAGFDAGTGDLSQRIAALESADPSGMPEASEDQIAAFRERLEAITADAEARLDAATEQAAELEARAAARAEEMEAEAAALAERAEADAARVEAEAERQAALADLRAAMENGTGFAPALETLGDAPEDLATVAEEGVPTLAELQRAFPSAARSAVTQAVAVPENASAGDRFSAFLKRRTGARSLTPQAGDAPDAVLSRAEAALAEGDLETAITEIESLPEPALDSMQSWLDRARTRAAALDAAAALTATN